METRPPSREQKATRNVIIEKELSHEIIAAFFYVYNTLGYGYAEKIYSRALEVVLRRKGHVVDREFPIDVMFEGIVLGTHRLDLVVERKIILELKSSEKLTDVPRRQLRNYLAASAMRLGIVLHFGPKPTSFRVLGPDAVGCPNRDGSGFV